MNLEELMYFANLSELNAEIEMMKAENTERTEQNHALAYDGEAFNYVRKEIETIKEILRVQVQEPTHD